MYKDVGGGHMYMIAFESDMPKNPGMLLETYSTLPKGNNQEISYYKSSDTKNRFEGKIFYTIILDTCEDIHDQSIAVLKEFFNNQLIIE
jgi:hypothetical protein